MVAIFQSWRLRLREVEEALKVGRLDEASQMLTQSGLLDYLPAKRLANQLSLLFSERSKRRAQAKDFAGGWKDLESAVALADLPACDVARRCLVDASIEATESLARCGDLAEANVQLDRLEKHAATHPRVQTLRQLVRSLQSARSLARRGKFGDAEAHLNIAIGLRPEIIEIQQQREECRQNAQRSCELSEQLFRALSESSYQDAVSLADQLLFVAPEMKLALEARKRAWKHVGAQVDFAGAQSTHIWGVPNKSAPMESNEGSSEDSKRSPRFVLWVDGVGGFLVCLSDEVILGQSVAGNLIDIPILGDLSRKHARIRRSGEGYVIDPLQTVKLNGKRIDRSTALCDGDELELGTGIRFRFRRPHALSASARLEPISRHRIQPSADGILLMAESCVLGPKWTNHVVCRDWSGDVVLYRREEELFCRAMTSIEIDGQQCDGRGRLLPGSRVVGSDFSMCLEELDKCSRQPLV